MMKMTDGNKLKMCRWKLEFSSRCVVALKTDTSCYKIEGSESETEF